MPTVKRSHTLACVSPDPKGSKARRKIAPINPEEDGSLAVLEPSAFTAKTRDVDDMVIEHTGADLELTPDEPIPVTGESPAIDASKEHPENIFKEVVG